MLCECAVLVLFVVDGDEAIFFRDFMFENIPALFRSNLHVHVHGHDMYMYKLPCSCFSICSSRNLIL